MRLNVDPGPAYEPSHARVTVISILARLEEQHVVSSELGDGTFLYWIEPKFRDGQIIAP